MFQRFCLIRTDLARVGANQPELARVAKPKKKKKGRGTNAQAKTSLARHRVGRGCGGRFAASQFMELRRLGVALQGN